MDIAYAPQFRRQFRKLPKKLQEEVFEKIELFSDLNQHKLLHVHKLSGKMVGRWSFSVNYRYRIVFMWEKQNKSAILLVIGDHLIYE
jgi:addiction module RelE/StbE family toxin